jgi:hypothetical protein
MFYANGRDVGQLKNDVTLTYTPERLDIKAGFPQQSVKNIAISETATLTAGLLEFDLFTYGELMGTSTFKIIEGASLSKTNQLLAPVSAYSYSNSGNPYWTPGATGFAVKIATTVRLSAAAGATTIFVTDTQGFHADDAATLSKIVGSAPVTETAVIASVNTGDNSITLTVGITNSYDYGALLLNDGVALASGTDYIVDYIGGGVALNPSSIRLLPGMSVAASYVHKVTSAEQLSFGGKVVSKPFPARFVHERDDGKLVVVSFPRAEMTGTLTLGFKEAEAMINDVEITGMADSSLPAGEQLVTVRLEEPTA